VVRARLIFNTDCNRDFRMTRFFMALTLGLAASPAFAGGLPVPEIDALSGLAAMGALGGVVALIWERRRRK
jgi:hypothetical protein